MVGASGRTGEVLLVQYAEYVPSVTQALSRRSAMTPKPPLGTANGAALCHGLRVAAG